MAHLNLFDSAGRFADPGHEALETLDDTGRALVTDIRNATRHLDAATAAIVANENALKETRVEIAALRKIVPVQSFNDLAKAAGAETQKRRAGL